MVDNFGCEALCKVCEVKPPEIICKTCVDPQGVSPFNLIGVFFCQECFDVIHSRGFFKKHVFEKYEVYYNAVLKTRLQEHAKSLKRDALNKVKDGISSRRMSIERTKLREASCKKEVNAQLRVVYTQLLHKLENKEREINEVVAHNISEFKKKKEKESEDLKEVEKTIMENCDTILKKFDDEDFNLNEVAEMIGKVKGETDAKLKEFDSLIDCGPYFNVNFREVAQENSVDISKLKISSLHFRSSADLIGDEKLLESLRTEIAPGQILDFRQPFKLAGVAVSSQYLRRAFLKCPHPAVVEHGKWIVDALETHLMMQYENGNLKKVKNIHSSVKENEILAVISNLPNGQIEINRCCAYINSKLKDQKEVQMTFVDRDRRGISKAFNKLQAYHLDPVSASVKTLAKKVSFNDVLKNSNKDLYPEASVATFKALETHLEKGKDIKVIFKEMALDDKRPCGLSWSAEVEVDGFNLSQLLLSEHSDSSPVSLGICRDIRVANNPGITVMRGNAADVTETAAASSPSDKAAENADKNKEKDQPQIVAAETASDADGKVAPAVDVKEACADVTLVSNMNVHASCFPPAPIIHQQSVSPPLPYLPAAAAAMMAAQSNMLDMMQPFEHQQQHQSCEATEGPPPILAQQQQQQFIDRILETFHQPPPLHVYSDHLPPVTSPDDVVVDKQIAVDETPSHSDTTLEQLNSDNVQPEVKEDDTTKVVEEQGAAGDCLPDDEALWEANGVLVETNTSKDSDPIAGGDCAAIKADDSSVFKKPLLPTPKNNDQLKPTDDVSETSQQGPDKPSNIEEAAQNDDVKADANNNFKMPSALVTNDVKMGKTLGETAAEVRASLESLDKVSNYSNSSRGGGGGNGNRKPPRRDMSSDSHMSGDGSRFDRSSSTRNTFRRHNSSKNINRYDSTRRWSYCEPTNFSRSSGQLYHMQQPPVPGDASVLPPAPIPAVTGTCWECGDRGHHRSSCDKMPVNGRVGSCRYGGGGGGPRRGGSRYRGRKRK